MKVYPSVSHRAVALLGIVVIMSTACGSTVVTQSNSRASTPASADPSATANGSNGTGRFTAGQPWSTDVEGVKKSDRSDAIIAALNELGGWGNDNVFQTDFGIPIFVADQSTPRVAVTGIEDYCYGGPDCDEVPAQIPVPVDAHMEGSEDLSCDIAEDDCHLLVIDRDENKLYEVYQGNKEGEDITAMGLFTWDLNKTYPETLRGDQCTSADAAGFPIAALTPTADEVAAGEINHALRFILPNDRMKADVYVRPATHAGGPKSTDPDAPPYGVRFRLKADFDDSAYSGSQKVVLAALKKYGMFLSDGGEIALTFADDKPGTAKWADLGIDSQSFNAITPDAFEVVGLGDEVELTYDCVRNR